MSSSGCRWEKVAFLENRGYRYAIIGGIALSQWEYLRFTYDIDIKVLVSDMNYEEVRNTLRQAFPEPARQHAPVNPFIVAVMLNEIVVIFLLTLPGYEEQIIERAVKRDLNGFSAWICSAEDLIIQKVVAGRGKDWPDIEAFIVDRATLQARRSLYRRLARAIRRGAGKSRNAGKVPAIG